MFSGNNQDLGAAMFKTWTEAQKSDEIAKLVEGYRNGVPIGILCKMAETIAGNKKLAKKYLKQHLTKSECKEAVESATGGMLEIVKSFLG